MAHILIVESNQSILENLTQILEQAGYQSQSCGSVEDALNLNLTDFDLIISNLRLPGKPGTELFSHTSQPLLISTSYASLRSALESSKDGAMMNYLAIPFESEEVTNAIKNTLSARGKQGKKQAKSNPNEEPVHGMVGSCAAMKELFRRIRKVALTHASVLIQGESGTGKELVARALHEASSRKDSNLISINCAAIPENLIESELFGHEKGAFTGATSTRTGLVEAANNGTLFLDEIGELPLEAQARLLRVLQEHEIRKVGSVQSTKVDVRLIAATHRDLQQFVNEGRFREDLFYRINVMPLQIPPLRERNKDILELADKKLDLISKRIGNDPMYNKELIRKSKNTVIQLRDENAVDIAEDIDDDPPEDLSLEDYFQRFVLEHQDQMNETQLAKKLGISRKCLWERRQRFGIPRQKKSG